MAHHKIQEPNTFPALHKGTFIVEKGKNEITNALLKHNEAYDELSEQKEGLTKLVKLGYKFLLLIDNKYDKTPSAAEMARAHQFLASENWDEKNPPAEKVIMPTPGCKFALISLPQSGITLILGPKKVEREELAGYLKSAYAAMKTIRAIN